MDLNILSKESQLSTDYEILCDSIDKIYIEKFATNYYNKMQHLLSDETISQSKRDEYILVLKLIMSELDEKPYKRVIAAYEKNLIQYSVDLPQNDDIQIHVTI